MAPFSESIVEDATLDWLAALGYSVLHGPEIETNDSAVKVLGDDANGAEAGGGAVRSLGVSLRYTIPPCAFII